MNADERSIRDLVAAWFEATRSGDLETVLGHMTDDVVFLVAGRPPMIGKSEFAAVSRAQATQGNAKFEGRSEIQEIGIQGDLAFMWTKLTVAITPPGGEAHTRSGHTLSVLRKVNGRWLLARDANLLTPT